MTGTGAPASRGDGLSARETPLSPAQAPGTALLPVQVVMQGACLKKKCLPCGVVLRPCVQVTQSLVDHLNTNLKAAIDKADDAETEAVQAKQQVSTVGLCRVRPHACSAGFAWCILAWCIPSHAGGSVE